MSSTMNTKAQRLLEVCKVCALDEDRVGGWSNSDPLADESEDGEDETGNTLITHHSIMQNEAPQRGEESVRQDTQCTCMITSVRSYVAGRGRTSHEGICSK